MKKILLITLIILLGWFAYFTVEKGFTMGTIEILSISNVQNKNKDLDNKIEEVNKLVDFSYPTKLDEVNQAKKNLEIAKDEYVTTTSQYTEEQILQATQENQYYIEYMWARVGNHARSKGVTIKMEIVAGETENINNLNFTVEGTYIAITEFIYAVEDDTELNFRIKSFRLLPKSGDTLSGTFTVKNVRILGNTSAQSVTTKTPATIDNTNTN